jgi:hypothetical protein
VGQASREVLFTGNALMLLRGAAFRFRDVEVKFAGARSIQGIPLERLPGMSNYFTVRQNYTRIPQFGRVRYPRVYPGIDVVFHGREYDLVVSPHADTARIRLALKGAEPRIENGDLVAGTLRQKRPHAYQMADGRQIDVPAEFVLDHSVARFRLGRYDRSLPLRREPWWPAV